MSRAPHDIPTELVPQVDPSAPGFRVVGTWTGGSVVVDLPLRGTMTLGRGLEADVRLEHASVSRRHASLVVGETMLVEDLGSANGTKVRGRALPPRGSAVIQPGDLVELGSTMMVVHRRSGGAAAQEPPASGASPEIVVADPTMERIYQVLAVVSQSDLSVLLFGETGVGKEILASHVHRSSPRVNGPFLKVNCAALVESLLEAELFGHERGAFTGALQAKLGLLEGAHQGTMFLDEVGELPLSIQAKLLRVLESGELTRVGSLVPRKVDVRFVAATNRDLKALVTAGKFREDLFFRLDGISVWVPPLRERQGEIAPLARKMVAETCASAARPLLTLADDALDWLTRYSWPGNIRELRNIIRRSVLLCTSDVLGAEDLRHEADGRSSQLEAAGTIDGAPAGGVKSTTSSTASPPAPILPRGSIKQAERDRIVEALNACGGNQTRAAQMLGVSRRTLVHKLDILGVPRPRKKDDET